MPKKILFESAVHQFLWAGSRLGQRLRAGSPDLAQRLSAWINALRLDHPAAGQLRVVWAEPPGEYVIELKQAKFYTRGDTAAHSEQQSRQGLIGTEDRVMGANMCFFDDALRAVLAAANVLDPAALARAFGATAQATPLADAGRVSAEEAFHDEW